MNLDKDVIIEIDKILDDGFNDKTIMVNRNNKNNHKAINICKGLDFITEKDGVTFRLKEKAILAIQDGGIEKYLANQRLDKDLERTVKDLTKKSLKNQVWNNLMYVVVGGIIASIPNIVSELKNSTEETQLYKQEYEKNALNEHYQTDIQQMRSEITSLQNEIDSLKNSSD